MRHIHHIVTFLTLLLIALLVAIPLVQAQVFFNGDHNSGMAVEAAPGITWYSDQTKSGFIVETMPGQVMYNLTGKNGKPGAFGFATDLTPRFTPSVDPMVDTLMPPVPHSSISSPATVPHRPLYSYERK